MWGPCLRKRRKAIGFQVFKKIKLRMRNDHKIVGKNSNKVKMSNIVKMGTNKAH